MRQIIPDRLWIGNALDARDIETVLSWGIRAVVDLAANEPPVKYPRDISYCRFPLNDGAENDPAILRLAVTSTAEFIKAQIPTLVACSAGMSRSPAIVAAAIAFAEKESPDDALLRIASSGPHDVAPALWADIKRIIFSPEESSRTVMTKPSLALVVLKTHQIESVLAFYRTLGVEFVEERHGKGPLHYAGQVGQTVFEIYPAKENESVDAATRLGFHVVQLTQTFELLRSSGAPIISEPKLSEWGTRAVLRDPDGRAVELLAR
jgi:predicted enzyme related to lactoylglutathione lyase